MALVFNHPTSGRVVIGATVATSRFVGGVGIAPGTTGTIPDQIFEVGTGERSVYLPDYFTGTALSFALQSAVTGVSITGPTLTIVDDSALASASVTVVASNAYGSDATQQFDREVTTPAAAQWYEDVFAYRDGTGVGPRVGSWTDAADWAAATSGVSASSSTVTVSGDDITATAIDFRGRRLIWTGANGICEDCLGNPNSNVGGNLRLWDFAGLNPTVRYNKLENNLLIGGVQGMNYYDASGTVTQHHNWFVNMCAPDPVKGPPVGVVLICHDDFMDGLHLTAGGHLDFYDMRGATVGSGVSDTLIVGDHTPTSAPAGGGTGFTNGIRMAPGDGHGGTGIGHIHERVIVVGSDDTGAESGLMSPNNLGGSDGQGVVFYDILYDLREHNTFINSGFRCDDWYVRSFDWDASVIAGEITGLSAPIAYPALGSHPAAVPSTMAAPVITGGSGVINWSANARPANQRSLITHYELRWSTNGSSWTTVTPVARTADSTSVAPGSNYRIQFRAVNGIGAGDWSASSNLVTVT